jgi:cytoskeletal protein RodZ
VKLNEKSEKRKVLFIGLFLLLVAVITAGALLYWHHTYTIQKASEQKPTFTFDTSQSPGWWSPGNYSSTEEDAKTYKGDAGLPVSNINAFKGKKGDTTDQCFVMASYQLGSIDVEATLKQKTLPVDSSSSYHLIDTKQHTIRTPEGNKEYSLYQYKLVTPTPSQYGNEFAFIPLSSGYIRITGICPTAELLASAETALEAISLHN